MMALFGMAEFVSAAQEKAGCWRGTGPVPPRLT